MDCSLTWSMYGEDKVKKNGVSFREKVYWLDGSIIAKTFKRKSDAQAWKRKLLCERDLSKATGIIVKDKVLFKDFSQKWFKDKVVQNLARATQAKYEMELRIYINPILGEIKLRDIEVTHALKLVSKLKAAERKPAGINATVSLMQGILNDAVRWGYLTKNPLVGFKQLKKDPPRDIFWTANEVERFLRANIKDPLYNLYLVAVNTGLRKGELAGLKWDCVSFERNTIDIVRTYSSRFGLKEATKTGEKRTLPMNSQVRNTLWSLLKLQKSEFVFCSKNAQPLDTNHIYRAFMQAQIKAGIDNKIKFHALRHTFASNFMMSGGNLYDLQKLLGHKSIEMTQRYAHLSPLHLEKAINIISFGKSSPILAHQEPEQKLSLVISDA